MQSEPRTQLGRSSEKHVKGLARVCGLRRTSSKAELRMLEVMLGQLMREYGISFFQGKDDSGKQDG